MMKSSTRMSLKSRFEAKFRVTPGCWEWAASKNIRGYGRFRLQGREGKTVMAHRFSYELYAGPIPNGLQILHKCDNPGCVNPDHLWPGTQKENMADKNAKGRGNYNLGSKCHNAVLTEEQVMAIRADRRKQRLIAADYGIRRNHVSMIKTGKLWAHVSDYKPEVQA